MILHTRVMVRIVWIIALIGTGFVSSKPYYYKESKQHTEHHKEYSYSGLESHSPPAAGQEEIDLYPQVSRPEKYVSPSYPALSSSLQSYSSGLGDHGSYFQSPIVVPHMPAESIQQYTTPNGGNVIVRKVVKVVSYPGTSSSNYFQISRHSSSSDGLEHLGSESNFQNLQSGSLLGQRQIHFNNDESSQREYVPMSSINGGRTMHINKVFKAEHQEIHGRGRPDITHTSHSYSLNQNPIVEDAESIPNPKPLKNINLERKELFSAGYNKKSDELRQEEERLHSVQHSGIEGGQQLIGSHTQEWLGQHEVSLQNLELGQKEDNLQLGNPHLEVGQEEVKLIPGQHDFEVGQEEVPLSHGQQNFDLNFGQKEEQISFNKKELNKQEISYYPGQQPEDIGKKEVTSSRKESEHFEVGQKEESLYPNQETDSLEIGQHEESLYPRQESIGIEVGQKEESIHFGKYSDKVELGQKEESLYPGQENENLQLGQKEESLYPGQVSENLELGQKEQSLYPGQESEHLELGQKEESLHSGQRSEKLELGQKEESLYPGQVSENLELGQKEQGLALGQKEESFEIGQKLESLYHTPGSDKLELGQKEISHHKKVENERSLGQKKQSFYLSPSIEKLNLGRTEINTQPVTGKAGQSYQHSSFSSVIELGQQELPSLTHTHYNKEVSQHLTPVQRKEGVDLDGQKEEVISINKPKTTDQGSVNEHVMSGQREQSLYQSFHAISKETPLEETVTENRDSPQKYGVNNHRYICKHNHIYTHGGYGLGQRGHDLQISNSYHHEMNPTRFISDNDKGEFQELSKSTVQGIKKETQGHIGQHEEQSENLELGQKKETLYHSRGDQRSELTPEFNFNKKLEDLAMELQLESHVKTSSTPIENLKTTPQTSPSDIHIAEIQELGLENFNRQRTESTPIRKVNVFETHSEEIGLNQQPIRKTYSKKHTRHSSVVKEETGASHPLQFEASSFHTSEPQIRQYGYHKSFSTQNGNSFQSDQPVQRQRVSGTEFFGNNQQTDRHAVIDEFLTELDKDIASSGGRRTQTGYVQVSSQHQQPSVRTSGSSMYYQSSYSSNHSSSSSSGSGGSSWYKRLGDNIGSSYNQAREKAKEIVETVKQKVSSYK